MNKARQHRRGCRYSDEFAPGGQARRWTVNSASTDMTERELLEAAGSGDEDAFRHLVLKGRPREELSALDGDHADTGV